MASLGEASKALSNPPTNPLTAGRGTVPALEQKAVGHPIVIIPCSRAVCVAQGSQVRLQVFDRTNLKCSVVSARVESRAPSIWITLKNSPRSSKILPSFP